MQKSSGDYISASSTSIITCSLNIVIRVYFVFEDGWFLGMFHSLQGGLGTLGTWSSSNIKEAILPYHPLGNMGIMVKGKEVVENEK